MPSFPVFNQQIDDIYHSFLNKKYIKEKIGKRKYKMYYHMHPNRRLKKMFYIFSFPVKEDGIEANVPFFTISVNKINKRNKKECMCIYNNLLVGGIKKVNLHFTLKEDEKGIQKNIRELQKVVKIFKLAFHHLYKDIQKEIDFYQQ
jgi:hypothetical protein